MSDSLASAVQNALSGMTRGPAPLMAAIEFYADQETPSVKATTGSMIERIVSGPNDQVRKVLHDHLCRWDWEEGAAWDAGTLANSRARRDRIYDLWRVDVDFRSAFDRYIPAYERSKAVVIDDPRAVRDWFTSDFRSEHNFYWERLRKFLQGVRALETEVVNSIESASDRILERLADPSSSEIFAARGLVVGYVQSGKTTNFTAVIAKAIDAGYRLIIVLSGTTNLLRDQTQRRLDMDLVGKENIQRGAREGEADHEYVEDEGWPGKFISYGGRPSLLGSVDIHRLTTKDDFARRAGGFNPLEFNFEKSDRRRPLFERVNLGHAGVRVAVVKKQRDRLTALIRELTTVGPETCSEVPALIIDDESDQASVNTVNPEKARSGAAEKQRSSINECIVQILKKLPRAQYLGYTATPFANVFVNPRDPEDLYPRHFIVSLDRPAGYMGAREFVDLNSPPPGKLSNKQAYIRAVPLVAKDKKEDNRLQEAMDAFVLAGAIKKFRLSRGVTDDRSFKHHTMLYHQSVRTEDQEKIKKGLLAMWKAAGYDSPGPAFDRLKRLLGNDFKAVSADRGSAFPFPESFEQLVPFIGQALDEICRGGEVVLMVNSAEGADVPDFDGKVGVWKIILGGAKLSRGYTIQGLTISYFRRQSQMQDTLMQMGRWFGYRPGYSDLVRLYIGVSEKMGTQTIDLYEAFAAMCRDEEDFRVQLAQYAGKDGITPFEVPALVFNTFPSLRPSSRNKMFNAEITWAAFNYREPTGQAIDPTGSNHNDQAFRTMLSGAAVQSDRVVRTADGFKFDIKWSWITKPRLAQALQKVQWAKAGNRIEGEIRYLNKKTLPIDRWLFIAPQLKEDVEGRVQPWVVDEHEFACVTRKRVGGSRFGVFSTSVHRAFAAWIIGSDSGEFECQLGQHARTGVMLFYPTWERKDDEAVIRDVPAMGFGLLLPNNPEPDAKRIAWRVKAI